MKDWLQKNYWILVLLFVAGMATVAYISQQEEEVIERKATKPDVTTWASEDGTTICYILDYGSKYQQLECIRETYRD